MRAVIVSLLLVPAFVGGVEGGPTDPPPEWEDIVDAIRHCAQESLDLRKVLQEIEGWIAGGGVRFETGWPSGLPVGTASDQHGGFAFVAGMGDPNGGTQLEPGRYKFYFTSDDLVECLADTFGF